MTLAEIAHRLGRMALEDVAATAKPNTILGWYRKLIANKFNGSRFRKRVDRPRVAEEIERLVVRMANENPSWGYDRIVGALANLGHRLSDQTVGNVLRRHGLSPAPKRKQTVSWKDFIRSHRDVLIGMDFFTAEVLTLKGLLTYYVLFFIHLETRRVSLVGFTPYPDQDWMEQQARNLTMEQWGCLRDCRYLLQRPRCQVLPIISRTDQDGKRESASLASKKPESELVCRTLGEISQRGMPGKAHPIWRVFAAASLAAIFASLP